MLPDRVSNPGPLTYESGALPIALRGPAFLFILKMVHCMFQLESPRWGDSNEDTQNTFMLKKIEKISLLSLLIWRYNK